MEKHDRLYINACKNYYLTMFLFFISEFFFAVFMRNYYCSGLIPALTLFIGTAWIIVNWAWYTNSAYHFNIIISIIMTLLAVELSLYRFTHNIKIHIFVLGGLLLILLCIILYKWDLGLFIEERKENKKRKVYVLEDNY